MMKSKKKELNVLMVAARYFPYTGGLETHVHEVGRRLASDGINITLLTTVASSLSSSFRKEEVVENMRIIRVRAWPANKDYNVAPAIYSVITGGQWDLVHCQGYHTFVPPLAMLAAKKAKDSISGFISYRRGFESLPHSDARGSAKGAPPPSCWGGVFDWSIHMGSGVLSQALTFSS